MKSFRIIVAALLLLAMVLPLASCQTEPLETQTVTQEETETVEQENPGVEQSAMPLTEHNISKIADSIQLIGERTGYNKSGELAVEWSGSGFEANLIVGEEGTDIRIGFRNNYAARWKVYVDGKEWGERVSTGNGNKKQIVARGIPAGEHNFKFVKDTEPGTSRNNYNNILSFAFNGEFGEKPADKDLYLEFVGDGYMVGFGSQPLEVVTGGKKELEETSFTSALPYLTATAMDADYSVVAHSEIGLSTRAGSFKLQALYENKYAYRDLDVAYEPDRTPDAVIIHVGMDDTLSSLTQGKFIEEMEKFIKQIREHYGKDVPVVMLYNTIYHTVRTGEMKAVVQKMGGEKAGVYALEMFYGHSGGGTKTVQYPNAEEHQKSTDILVPFLQDLLK